MLGSGYVGGAPNKCRGHLLTGLHPTLLAALVIDVVRSPSLHIQNVTSATGKGQELIITALSVSLTTDKGGR